jgi:hypothetical protein
MEQVGNIVIDFDVMSTRPKNLIVADSSEWIYAENLPAYMLITIPGSKKVKTFPFKKNSLNRLNSHLLGLSCLTNTCEEEVYINLPDGIYTICIKSGYEGIENTKFYLKTDMFKQELAKVMVKYGLEYTDQSKKFLEEMMFIKGLVSVAEAHAYEGDFVKAQRFFEEAKGRLKDKVECKDCI